MKFGYFDDANREYVITTPKTPLPWINYLGCNEFFSLISNTCGGYTFYKDAKLLRITRYRYNDVPLDINGKYFYVKEGGDVWNPGWKLHSLACDGAAADGVDVSGGTITSQGVQKMLFTSLEPYTAFFKKLEKESSNKE